MPEGLSSVEVGKELAQHTQHQTGPPQERDTRRDRTVSILEAILLAVVAMLAAWSGYASAKWGTESSLSLAKASAARTEANRAQLAGIETRNFDASTFNTWFSAYTANDRSAMRLAEKRFRPEFRVAFDAWLATNPDTNPDAPPGPTYMPQYRQPKLAESAELDAKADEHYNNGSRAGTRSDDYVRITVFLASVLFLVGIASHLGLRAARYGLVGVGVVMLGFAVAQLLTAPKPPTG
jgi:hypothetical protein